MTAKTFSQLLIDLDILASYSRPRTSDDNPYSESHFKTVKYAAERGIVQMPPLFLNTRWGRAVSTSNDRNGGIECTHEHPSSCTYTGADQPVVSARTAATNLDLCHGVPHDVGR